MSDTTLAAIEDAIRAHIADGSDNGEILTDWYLIAAVADMSDDGATNYIHIASNAPLHTLHGLVDLAHRRLIRSQETDYE